MTGPVIVPPDLGRAAFATLYTEFTAVVVAALVESGTKYASDSCTNPLLTKEPTLVDKVLGDIALKFTEPAKTSAPVAKFTATATIPEVPPPNNPGPTATPVIVPGLGAATLIDPSGPMTTFAPCFTPPRLPPTGGSNVKVPVVVIGPPEIPPPVVMSVTDIRYSYSSYWFYPPSKKGTYWSPLKVITGVITLSCLLTFQLFHTSREFLDSIDQKYSQCGV